MQIEGLVRYIKKQRPKAQILLLGLVPNAYIGRDGISAKAAALQPNARVRPFREVALVSLA